MLPVIVDRETHRQLQSLAEEDPETRITIDLPNQTLTLPDGRTVNFPIDPFSKHCLVNGIDQLGYLREHLPAIEEYEKTHPQRVKTIS